MDNSYHPLPLLSQAWHWDAWPCPLALVCHAAALAVHARHLEARVREREVGLGASGSICQLRSCVGMRLGWLDGRRIACLVIARHTLGVELDGVCIERAPN